MLEVHTSGKGICGLFTREIAETKVSLVNDYSQRKPTSSPLRNGKGLKKDKHYA